MSEIIWISLAHPMEHGMFMSVNAQAKTTITFDCTLLSPDALREMANAAIVKRDEMDGVSAAHYLAWNNLAAALQDKAASIETADSVNVEPSGKVRLNHKVIGRIAGPYPAHGGGKFYEAIVWGKVIKRGDRDEAIGALIDAA